jgi:catechol 2,3-dioxygenase-like lactoylglutathione lyase family enzyme
MSGLSFLVLECANLAASRHFYETLLSVRFVVESHGAGPEHLSAVLEGGVVLELYPGGGARGVRLGLSIRDVPAARRRLGAETGPLRDPDGRRVILVEPV